MGILYSLPLWVPGVGDHLTGAQPLLFLCLAFQKSLLNIFKECLQQYSSFLYPLLDGLKGQRIMEVCMEGVECQVLSVACGILH